MFRKTLINAIITTLVALVVIEGGFWVSSFFASKQKTNLNLQSTGSNEILFIGESTSYGDFLEDRYDAYPYLVVKWLNENKSEESRGYKLINYSWLGQTSYSVMLEFDHLLRALSPALVVFQLGVNNFNPVLNPIGGQVDGVNLPELLLKIKTFKFITLFYARTVFSEHPLDSVFSTWIYGKSQSAMDDNVSPFRRAALSSHYHEMIMPLKKRGIPVLLLSYLKITPQIKETIMNIAENEKVNYLDLSYERNLDFYIEPIEFFLSSDDWHPNKKAHKVIAQIILDYIHQYPSMQKALELSVKLD